MSAIESPLFWNPGVRHEIFKNLNAPHLSLMDRTNTVFHNAAFDYSTEAFPALWARILEIEAVEPFLPAIQPGETPSLRHLGELRQNLLQALDDAGVQFRDPEESISPDFFGSLILRLLEQGNIALAAERGNLAAVRLLFPEAPEEEKTAAFCHAASEGHADIIRFFSPLMKHSDHERAMGEALVYNHLPVVQVLDPYLGKSEREYFLAASTEIGNHDAVRFFAPKCNRISKDLALIDAAQSGSFENL